MTHTDDALAALSGPRWRIADAPDHVPDTRGLYAILGDKESWTQLGVKRRPDELLYVGKAEDSLVRRELRGHFAIDPARPAQTGSSTVRRSFAALLHDALALRGIPRNPAKPGHSSNYGLSAEHDAVLTSWMHKHLTLAVWPATGVPVPLRAVATGSNENTKVSSASPSRSPRTTSSTPPATSPVSRTSSTVPTRVSLGIERHSTSCRPC